MARYEAFGHKHPLSLAAYQRMTAFWRAIHPPGACGMLPCWPFGMTAY
jgi:hypothetical protein